ncbi:MAG: NAD(P)H-dependent oxidoreductase [Nitrospinae bacterium]|nr:NAD(P)H-dependent oxidoreductase [Nitrospinota bacterium]
MQLTVFNGSPRGKGSNTKVLVDQFLDGFMKGNGNSYKIVYLNTTKDSDYLIKMFEEAEKFLLAFPLYVDSMPTIVKTFIESLEPLCGRKENPDIGFLVQSGLPESIHSRYVERYLKKLSARLGCSYMGTIIKGGVEGAQAKPVWMNKKLFNSFYQLGKTFGETGKFDEEIVDRLAQPERYSKIHLWLFKLFGKFWYWDTMLKKNNAFEKRFNKPYLEVK